MNGLPDIAGLAAVAPADWRELRQRLLSVGVDAAGVAPILGLAARFSEDERDPIRIWHLRRRDDAAALAMRLLMFSDTVPAAQSIAVLGDRLHGLLTAAGLLREADGQLRCALRLAMADDFHVFADDLTPGGDVVMGVRDTAVPLWRATVSERAIPRALDLGCGAGLIALLLSRRAGQVVATDLNPRAVALARINVALNGVANVEVREGDMFAPVAGETFDLIAAHPPYVALPDGLAGASHMHGGPRGDEVAGRVVAELAPHVAPGGQVVVHAHWPLHAGETLADHVRAAAGPALDLLVLRLGTTGADDLATFWGRRDGGTVAGLRDHYARLGIVGIEAALCVLRRGNRAPVWTASLEVPPASAGLVTAERIALILRGCDLLNGADSDLLAARLRVPEGASIANVASADGTRAMLMLPPATLRLPVDVTPEMQRMLMSVNGAASVGVSGQPLAGVRQALARGALEPQ